MWQKIALRLTKYLATTEKGQKLLKGILIGVLCFFMMIPVALFAPIAAFVGGIENFFTGEEGEDLDDSADLDALLNGTLILTNTKYYKTIEKARERHISEKKAEARIVANQVREANKRTESHTSTDAEGNEYTETETIYPEVEIQEPEPPIITTLAYFCTTKEIQIADAKKKLSLQEIINFYTTICRPLKVEERSEDYFVISVEYMSDEEIAQMLLDAEVFEDAGDVDLFQVSIERLTEMMQESGSFGYDGIPSGNISNTTVAQQIWTFFKSKGWTDYACAAIIGNFEAECGLKPNLQETGGTGIGLGQWSFGRRDKFLQWLHSNGKDIKDITAQCEYILVENTWYAGNVKLYNSGGLRHQSKANSLSEFGTYKYQQLSDAVDDFLWHWESPNYKKAQQDRRQGAAQDAYNLFAGGGNPSYTGSYAQIKKSFFPGGRLPESEAAMEQYVITISFLNSKGVKKNVRVHKTAAADLLQALTDISAGGYEIKEISGFVWKNKTNSSSNSRSSHSYGLAIDINWNYGNPQVKNGKRLVGNLDYGTHELSIRNGDLTQKTFSKVGWKWGGNWTSSKDYMHFSVPGD